MGVRRRTFALTAVGGLSLSLAACGASAEDPSTEGAQAESTGTGEPVEIQLAHVLPATEDSFYHTFAENFAEKVNEYSEESITVEIVPNGQLGGERDVVEGLQLGSTDATIVGSFILGQFDPTLMVFDLPFVFEDYESARDVLRSDFMDDVNQSLEEEGFIAVGWGQGGYRNVLAKTVAVQSVEDLSNVKIRLPENPIYVETFGALGANPTPMAYTEVFAALEQGTIDAVEGAAQNMYDQGFWEAAPYYSETRHVFSPAPLLLSATVWDSLSAEQQEAVLKAGEEAADDQWEFVLESEEKYWGMLEEEGVNVTRDLDLQPFQEATASVIEKFRAEIGEEIVDDLLERVDN